MSLGKNVAKGYFSPNRLLKRRLIKKRQNYLEGRQTKKIIYTLVFFYSLSSGCIPVTRFPDVCVRTVKCKSI